MRTTLDRIAQDKTNAEEALKKMGLIKTQFAGWVYPDRLNFLKNHGYLQTSIYKKKKYNGFTYKANEIGYINVLKYLHGDIDNII